MSQTLGCVLNHALSVLASLQSCKADDFIPNLPMGKLRLRDLPKVTRLESRGARDLGK